MRIIFNKSQLSRIASISSDIGQVIFAAVVLPALIAEFNLTMIILGLEIAAVFWILSIKIEKKVI